MRLAPLALSGTMAVASWLMPAVGRAQFADAHPLEIRSVALSTASVPTFSPVEITADVAATYENPFDPDQIAVDAEVIAPDGKSVTVPGFLDVPCAWRRREAGNTWCPAGRLASASAMRRPSRGSTGWC